MENEPLPRLWNRNYIKVWISNFLLHFAFMLLAPLLPLYLTDVYQADKQMIGIVLSGYTVAALVVRPFSGYIVDSFPRKTVLLVCYFLFFVFFAGYLVAGTLAVFAIFRTLHGGPFGAATVANSTVAIDVLDSRRRAEGIGYFGLSNNLSMALGPSMALWIFSLCHNYDVLFLVALLASLLGLICNSTVELRDRELLRNRRAVSLDRFFLLRGWSHAICVICYSFSWGVMSTYIAIYGREQYSITGGTGLFFMLVALGLIISRLVGRRGLRDGKLTQNAAHGVLISLCAYFILAAVHNRFGYYASGFILGLGNGHMYPAFQSMFINLASNDQRGTANSSILISWDIGVGLGVILGGVLAENFSYYASFWCAWVVNLMGVLFYLCYTRSYFERWKLR